MCLKLNSKSVSLNVFLILPSKFPCFYNHFLPSSFHCVSSLVTPPKLFEFIFPSTLIVVLQAILFLLRAIYKAPHLVVSDLTRAVLTVISLNLSTNHVTPMNKFLKSFHISPDISYGLMLFNFFNNFSCHFICIPCSSATPNA